MATELDVVAMKVYLLFQGLPFNLSENNVTSDDEVDLVLVGNSTEPANVITVGNNTTQSTTGNVVPHNVPHNLENVPVRYEFNNFVMNRALEEDFLRGQGEAEENRNNLGQESVAVLNLPERQSNSSNANADNIAQNDDNTSETEIVDPLQEDHHLNDVNTATAAADVDDDDDFDDVDYDDEPSSSETDDEFDGDNSDFDSDNSDFHDLIEIHFTIIVLWYDDEPSSSETDDGFDDDNNDFDSDDNDFHYLIEVHLTIIVLW